jgi:hypothetical protein
MILDPHWGRDRRRISNVPDSAVDAIRAENDSKRDGVWAARYGVTRDCIAKIRRGKNRIHKYENT